MYNTHHSRSYRIRLVTSKYYILSSLRTANYGDLSIRPTDNNKSTTTAGATAEPLHRTYKKTYTITDGHPRGCGSPGCHIIDNNIHGMYLSLILYIGTLYIYTYTNIHNNTQYTILQRRWACGNNDPMSSTLRTTTTRLSDMILVVMLPT